MPKFYYKAKSPTGSECSGMVVMNSEKAVTDYLSRNGMKNIRITSGDEEFDLNVWLEMRKKVKEQEMIIFCRQMHTLLRAGVSITMSLKGLSDATPGLRFKTILKDLANMLEEGKEFSLALQKYDDVFSELFINLVKVGEKSGTLADVFARLAKFIEFNVETNKRIKGATRYPMMVMFALAAAMVLVNVMVIPTFADLFNSLGAELPIMTQVLLASSDFMLNYWYILLIGVVVIYGGIRHALSTPVGGMFWAEKKLGIPLVGKIIKKSALANFCQSFAMMYRSGISMLDILSIVSSTFNNVFLSSRIMELRGFIEQGDELTTAVEKINLFPPLVIQMFRVGDQTGEIDALLDEVAGMYEREIEYDVKKLGESIEPLLIAVMAAAVAVLALGIFVPMWDMAGAMKGG